MRTIIVLQHDAQSPPALIGEYLRDAGFALDLRRLDAGEAPPDSNEIGRAVALIALGLDAGVGDSRVRPDAVAGDGGDAPTVTAGDPAAPDLVAPLADALALGLPTLAVGSGAQRLVLAGGGDLYERAELDLGWEPIEFAARDELVRGVDPQPLVFSWRTHVCRLPDGAVLLADSAAEPQIFRVGEVAWGIVFHPEIDKPLLRAWLDLGADLIDGGPEGLARLRRMSRRELLRSAMLCGELMANFLTLARVREP